MKLTNFNQTAYRILVLLRWLVEKPLTFEEINDRFTSAPWVGKKVSKDTLWLYINTLKALGCKISRPTSKNGYRYRLAYHPFSYFITSQDIQTLKEVLLHVDERVDYWDVLHFCKWLQKIFHHTANKDRQALEKQFFSEVRLLAMDTLEQRIYELEQYCQAQQLLHVQYYSSEKGLRTMTLLPHKIFHHRSILYLLGQSPDWENSSMLRLDKIERIIPVDDAETHQALVQKQYQKQLFVLRILNCSPEQYEPLGDNDEALADPLGADQVIVKIRTDNEFLLKQKLLASGYQFQIVSPPGFRRDLQQTLYDMRQLYVT